MILADPYAGYRKWWHDPHRTYDPALASIWTDWDYILLRAYQYIEDYTTDSGHLVWVEQDPDVGWDIEKVESFYAREMHQYRENHEVKEWETLHAKPVWESDVEPPSMEKWLKRMEEEQATGFPSMPEGGTPRPPTAAEMAALMNPPEQNA